MLRNLKRTICRLCLTQKGELLSIFESKGIPGWTAAIAITELLQIQVSEGAAYAKHVCIDCMSKLEEFKKFKQQCESNNELLDRAYAGSRIFGANEEETVEKVVCGNENQSEFYLKEEYVEVVIEKYPLDSNVGGKAIKTEDEDSSNDYNEMYSTKVIESDVEISHRMKNQSKEHSGTLETNEHYILPHSSASIAIKEEIPDIDDPCGNNYEESDNSAKKKALEISAESDYDDGTPGFSGGMFGSSAAYDRFIVPERHDGSCHSSISYADDKAGPNVASNVSGVECINVNRKKQINEPSNEVNTCDICGKRLALMKELEAHMSCHRREKRFKCGLCGRAFHLNGSLEQHKCKARWKKGAKPAKEPFTSDKELPGVRTVKKPFECSECGRKFSNKNGLEVHVMSHFGDGPYKCHVCGKAFSRKHHLNVHILIHSGDRPFKCSQCSKAFFQKVHLIKHAVTHSRNPSYRCNQCDETFSERDHYRNHLSTHSEERVFKCDACGKEFNTKVHFQRHSLTHTGDRPFKCTECSMTFCQKVHLKTHMMTHSGARPFECTMCSKAFTRKAHLQTHLMTHSGARPFSCTKCTRAFTQKTHLNTHMVTHHSSGNS